MHYSTIVKLVSADNPQQGIAGVKVSLFDRDTFTPDDLLGTGTTDEAGEVRFDYSSSKFVDLDDKVMGIFPELYIMAYDQAGERVVSTRSQSVDNTPRKRIMVPLPAALVARLTAAPSAPPAQA